MTQADRSVSVPREFRLKLAPVIVDLPARARTCGYTTVQLFGVNGEPLYNETVPDGELPRRIAEAISYVRGLDSAVAASGLNRRASGEKR